MPRVRIGGVTLYYEVSGRGLPLVFAHGGGGNLVQWAFQVPHFSRHYRVITYDNRGHGRSDSPERGYSLEHFSEDLRGLIDYLELGKIVLIGLTMGAMTALRFALDHPDRLQAMVLVGATDGGREAMRERFETSARIAEEQGMEMLAEAFCAVVFSEWFSEKNGRYVEMFKANMKQASARGYANSIRAMAHRPPLKPRLHEITARTLVIVGEDDVTGFPLEDAELFAREIPQAEMVKIPGAGHLACIERPDVFNSVVDEFLISVGWESGRSR